MGDKDVLTQEEIDALLSGVDDGDVDIEEENARTGVVEYDLTNQDRVVRGRLPTLELITERFARMLRNDLPGNLKFPIEVGPGGVQVLKYSEYVEMLFVPTCIKLVRVHPFSGTCLVTLDAKVIHRIVDRFFGGGGDVRSLDGKEFTPTELKVVDRVLDLVFTDFEAAWRDVLPIEIEVVGAEVNPGLVNVMSHNEALMICSFRLEMADEGGELHIAFPYAALEPYKRLLDTTKQDQEDDSAQWRAQLERSLLDAELPLSCVIGDANLRVRDLMQLKVGDVLDLNMQEVHEVRVANIPKFTATLGDSRGKFALEFDSFATN
jgi:flagellar motor switch protein FliM